MFGSKGTEAGEGGWNMTLGIPELILRNMVKVLLEQRVIAVANKT